MATNDSDASFSWSPASRADFASLGSALAAAVQDGDVICLEGELGAGKTSFAQAFAQALGVTAPVVSPTFNILCTYPEGRLPLHHFDLYRLDGSDQLEDVDFWALSDDSTPGVCLIEWADLFPNDMPEDTLTIQIGYIEGCEDARNLRLSASGSRAGCLLKVAAQAFDGKVPRKEHDA